MTEADRDDVIFELHLALGDYAFVACMIEEIAARVVALEAMVAGG